MSVPQSEEEARDRIERLEKAEAVEWFNKLPPETRERLAPLLKPTEEPFAERVERLAMPALIIIAVATFGGIATVGIATVILRFAGRCVS